MICLLFASVGWQWIDGCVAGNARKWAYSGLVRQGHGKRSIPCAKAMHYNGHRSNNWFHSFAKIVIANINLTEK